MGRTTNMNLEKTKFFLTVFCAATLLVTRVHGSDNSSNIAAEPKYGVQDASEDLEYPRTKENITKLVDSAKKLMHEIYGCENGTIWCPASTRMTDLLFGVLIKNSEEETSTRNILGFMSYIMKVAAPNCPIRHTCTCITTSLGPDTRRVVETEMDKKVSDRLGSIRTVIGCWDTECGNEGSLEGLLLVASNLAYVRRDMMKLSYRAILYFLDEILYLIRPCSHSCKRIEDGCESQDLKAFTDRWKSHHLNVQYAKKRKRRRKRRKEKQEKEGGKRKRKKIRRRKKRHKHKHKHKKSKQGGSSWVPKKIT